MEVLVAVDALRSHGKPEGDALLSEYVQRYRRLIERLCRILLGDSGDAEDATQQTFLLAYQSLLSGTRPHHPRAWLCTIARRECWARDHRRRRERMIPRDEARTEPDPAERTVLRAELATISAGLKELPARQRQAIVLREMAGLSYTQLAAALEISESAAEALLVRARRNLREARLALGLLLSFPGAIRRLLRLGSGHARTAVGVQAAKAVAVVTIVTATTAVAGSSVPVHRAAGPPPKVARAATAPRPVKKPSHRSAPRSRPAVRHVLHARVAPARPAASAARVQTSGPATSPTVSSAPVVAAAAPAAAPVQPAAPVHSAPRPQVSKPARPRPHPPAPKHEKPPHTAKPPTIPTPTTQTPPPPPPPPPPTDTTETQPPPPGGATPGTGGSGNGAPGDSGDGDTRPGNGNGDQNHDHSGDNGHHGHH